MVEMLELGGGTNPHPRADIVIDLHHPKNSPPQDAERTPWEVKVDNGIQVWQDLERSVVALMNESVDEVYSSHFMEHIHKGQPIINVMNEVWRVLKPGGTFTMIMPLAGFTDEAGHGQMVSGWQPYADPTHVQFWWLPESILYFCEGPFKPHADYGLKVWQALGQRIPEERASMMLKRQQVGQRDMADQQSWWAIRNGWEGVVRLVKP